METVLEALKAMGKATSIEIAARTEINQGEVVNQLWDLKRSGIVKQHRKTWMLVDETPGPQSDAAFLNTIPQMAKRQAEMVCPTPKSIGAEIRRTKSRLTQLEELRITVRTLTRQRRALGM